MRKTSEKKFRYKGRVCVIKFVEFEKVTKGLVHHGHYCAYAETTLVGTGYSDGGELSPDSLISCHGGLTFAGELEGHGKKWFFGMDFAHAYDDEKGWTLEQVKKETLSLCNEVISYETDKDLKGIFAARKRLSDEIDMYKRKKAAKVK